MPRKHRKHVRVFKMVRLTFGRRSPGEYRIVTCTLRGDWRMPATKVQRVDYLRGESKQILRKGKKP